MNLYTLDENFLKKDSVDSLSTAIWTERYSKPGDVVLTMKATSAAVQMFAEGTFLSLSGSKEVAILDTQSIENGVLKVEGKTLLDFTRERLVRAGSLHHTKGWYVPNMTPSERIGYLVEHFLVNGVTSETPASIGFDGDRQLIPNLTMGAVDISGDEEDVFVPYGTLYDALVEIAQEDIGMSLYLDSADLVGYSLKFKVYRGRNLTGDQDVLPAVRFSPAMDSLANVKELRSIAGYKNVAYAFASGMEDLDIAPGIAYADGAAETSVGFDRRTLMIFVDDMNEEYVPGTEAAITAILNKRARDGLANNNFTRVVDGEVVPQSQFQFGVHYLLGDIVELEGHSGLVQKARITEFIRTQDETGERAYPTVSVIE